ncbi:MAG: hypothetical protein ACD_81C00040G0001 [uncultured bacterium]|uniref:VTT domain-containing protein n=1 Tax=Candidatus Wolfebacteria bacterium GW2011_GWE2_44_13 TaxID=1619017 RepID=A0A0G1HBN2_9BACT|nr:MAG: hypothetical protein ACD_81C00040G0001 [uncultured bacterium]KKT43933.1 MAG: hypothetical protein UW32_C0001G0525 [Candidatus Wolfebacteria bacterium GW2011_GWE2_44_13]
MHKKQIFIVGALLLFIFILFASSAIFQDVFFRVTDKLDAYAHAHSVLGPLVFVGFAAMSALLSPFSSVPLVPLAIVVWGTETTALLLLTGWVLGGGISYSIGYFLGYPVVQKIAPKRNLEKWMETLSEKIDISVAFLFRLATPSETGYVFGTLHYSFWKYMCITLVAELPFVYIAVYGGEAFINVGWITFLTLGLSWLLIVGIALYLLDKRLKR